MPPRSRLNDLWGMPWPCGATAARESLVLPRAGVRGPARAVRERLPWRDPASKRVRFIVPATSSAASHGHQAPQPGGGHSGVPAVSGGHTTGATGAATGPSPAAQNAEITGTTPVTGTARVKRGIADMLKGGVIMDVVTPEQAKIA